MKDRWTILGLIALAGSTLAGCEAAYLLGGMAQNFDYANQTTVLSKYDGVENQPEAVIV